MPTLPQTALDQLFFTARSRNGWQDKPVPLALLKTIFEASVMGPTAANSQPQRIVFVMSEDGRKKLLPIMHENNRVKVAEAPVTALLGFDMRFHEQLKITFPHAPDAYNWFEGDDDAIYTSAFRNASLQAAYFMLAARAYGLDCGPMSGFDEAAMNAAFFTPRNWRVNFACCLGYGSDARLFGRLPRLDFNAATQII